MEEAVKSIADASKEIAVTTSDAIKATEKLGGYLAPLIKEPIECVIGLLTDKLKYVRWERQTRLAIKIREKIEGVQKEHKIIPIPPKIALPIIENASIEENDYLQDIWVRLLASAAIEPEKVKSSFIDMNQRYFNYFCRRYKRSEFMAKLLIAVTSSGSVASLIIWKMKIFEIDFSLIWQVLTVASASASVCLAVLNYPSLIEKLAKLGVIYQGILSKHEVLCFPFKRSVP
jgi:hypothetical protein